MSLISVTVGDIVDIPWGLDEVRGEVEQIYGPSHAQKVVVRLSPDLSGSVVDESTTVTLPVDAIIRKVPGVRRNP